jgi:hypothetical protein
VKPLTKALNQMEKETLEGVVERAKETPLISIITPENIKRLRDDPETMQAFISLGEMYVNVQSLKECVHLSNNLEKMKEAVAYFNPSNERFQRFCKDFNQNAEKFIVGIHDLLDEAEDDIAIAEYYLAKDKAKTTGETNAK